MYAGINGYPFHPKPVAVRTLMSIRVNTTCSISLNKTRIRDISFKSQYLTQLD